MHESIASMNEIHLIKRYNVKTGQLYLVDEWQAPQPHKNRIKNTSETAGAAAAAASVDRLYTHLLVALYCCYRRSVSVTDTFSPDPIANFYFFPFRFFFEAFSVSITTCEAVKLIRISCTYLNCNMSSRMLIELLCQHEIKTSPMANKPTPKPTDKKVAERSGKWISWNRQNMIHTHALKVRASTVRRRRWRYICWLQLDLARRRFHFNFFSLLSFDCL